MLDIMYKFDKDSLPRPIVEGREDFIELYYAAWELAFKNIEYINRDGWKDILKHLRAQCWSFPTTVILLIKSPSVS